MVDFGDLTEKAQGLIGGHTDELNAGVDKVGDFLGDKIGHDKVDGIEEKIHGFIDNLGGGQGDAAAAAPDAEPAQ